MNSNKVRDQFSARLEGQLTGARLAAFESKLMADPELRREYDLFCKAIQELGESRNRQVEIPADLHERISASLDRHIYEQRRKQQEMPWWRRISLVATAAAAIGGAIIAFRSGGDSFVSDPSGLSSGGAGQFALTNQDGQWVASYRTEGKEKFSIVDSATNKVLIELELNKKGVESPLVNQHPGPGLVIVRTGATQLIYVAIPGTERSTVRKGNGTILDLAKAIAAFYGLPVEVRTSKIREEVSWDFQKSDPVESAYTSLVGTSVNVRQGATLIFE